MAKKMTTDSYCVIMFAHNEAGSVAAALESVLRNTDHRMHQLCILANGCTDATAQVARGRARELGASTVKVHEIGLGDKCNAWNTYVHDLSAHADTHFFCDADLSFSDACFPRMHDHLMHCPADTTVVAGLPLSGRNIKFYRSLVQERSCFFGGLYGLRHATLESMRSQGFRLPVGLNWIDSTLTKAVNTDLTFDGVNRPNRTTWVEGCGYSFESLSILRPSDISLYLNRIARYELGMLQEPFLDDIGFEQWPADLTAVNRSIDREFDARTVNLSLFKRYLIRGRLTQLLRHPKCDES